MMFLRHATSKVRSREDLGCIATLGFRGEAMASIHAVSRIEVLTRQQDCNEGTRYVGEGSQTGQMEPAGCPVGTTVKVCDLFYNTPARMKFFKEGCTGRKRSGSGGGAGCAVPSRNLLPVYTGGTDPYSHAGRRQAAVSHPCGVRAGIYPRFGSGGLHRRADSCRRLYRSSGRQPFQPHHADLFVNGRYVKSGTARAALEEAYKHSIMVGKFPACVLNLSIPFTETDINVHPAKIEVRFTNERPVFDAVYYAVKDALSREDYTPVPKQTKSR